MACKQLVANLLPHLQVRSLTAQQAIEGVALKVQCILAEACPLLC